MTSTARSQQPGAKRHHTRRTHRSTRRARRRTTPTPRRLGREVPGTLAVLPTPEDLAAMSRYRTFPFTGQDHPGYLRRLDSLLRTLTAQGRHTALTLFDPAEYATYCTDTGLDPDRPESRARYTTEIATAGATVPYTGRRLTDTLPTLLAEADRQETWDRAGALLSDLGRCPTCAGDTAHDAFEHASQATLRLLDALGPGRHHLVCSVPTGAGTPLLAAVHATADHDGRLHLAEAEALVFCTVLAAGIALRGPGGVVARTLDDQHGDVVRGWSLRDSRLTALTAAEVFSAYCTDARTGDPISPEPGVDYLPGIALPAPDYPHRHCGDT
ncbi:hypothetical protein [Streptomyces sp. Ru73]|uniref:hypothetical protein n=1 Tax=Streptomyces sp. Ru73 TaxID=2080748 RepID=UPI0021562D73|nr:hypothetical protein [Streptomyces sp. Ru73]